MRKVYIINYNDKVNMNEAAKHGQLISLTQHFFKIDSPNTVYNIIRKHIKESSADDYLLISGNGALIAVVVALWFMRHGLLNLLVWKPYKNSIYEPLTIPSFDFVKSMENEGVQSGTSSSISSD